MLTQDIIVPGNYSQTIDFCVDHFIQAAKEAIQDHGAFYAALSGGSTPKKIFERLCHSPYKEKVDWKKVHLFWSDERCVSPNNPDSNYHMAMSAGFKEVPPSQIHRMEAEREDLEASANEYEALIRKIVPNSAFDYLMLGLGEDGHTASLFPNTKALSASNRLVIANEVPQKKTWRMTLTFDCINRAHHIVIYVLGSQKKEIIKEIFTTHNQYPIQKVGTLEHKALFIADQDAAADRNF